MASATAAAAALPVLYGYWRSSCSWRVRIALHLKAIPFEQRPVNVLKGEHRSEELAHQLPFTLVPSLVLPGSGHVLTESLAIMEYLEEKFPNSRKLLPATATMRARVRALTLLIVADTQPLQNLGVLMHLSDDNAKREQWARHWIERAFVRLERELTICAGKFSFGNEPTFLDCCIPPQVYNAKRFGVDMAQFPTIDRLDLELAKLPEFQAADAFHQPDTPAEQRIC